MRNHRLNPSRRADSRRALPLLGLPCLLAALLACGPAGCSSAAPKPTGPWSAYPSTPALDAVKATHADAAGDREQRLLLTTWFPDGDPNVAQVCSVLPDGHVNTYRFIYDSSLQDNRKRDLSGEQLAALKQDLDALPPSQSAPLEDLLVVSFRQGGRQGGPWVTRFYDRTRRPPAVSDLFSVTGAPIDPE